MTAKSGGKKIRVVVADDHAVLRESLVALLGTQPDFRVEGKAANGTQTLELVRLYHPDVLVLDLAMPEGDGFDWRKASWLLPTTRRNRF